MNKVVLRHFPAEQLPDEVRERFRAGEMVTLEVTSEREEPARALTLEEIFASRKPPFRSAEEIMADIYAGRYDDQ